MTRAIVLTVILCTIALPCWWIIGSNPIYHGIHAHDSQKTHTHRHRHDSDSSHGHKHFLSFIGRTHSHPHHHDHHHVQTPDFEALNGLTEIGHLHQANGTIWYWARAELVERNILLSFMSGDASGIHPTLPSGDSMIATINHGNDVICNLTFRRSDQNFIATVSEDYFFLPTHSLSISDVEFLKSAFTSQVPLHDGPARPNRPAAQNNSSAIQN